MKPIDRLISTSTILTDRVRLSIMAALASSSEPLDFFTLLEMLQLTKGNLSSHALKLEQAGLIKVVKEFVSRKPKTSFVCTSLGRKEVQSYLATIEQLIKQTSNGGKSK